MIRATMILCCGLLGMAATTSAQSEWTLRNPPITAQTLLGVTWNGEFLVAVGHAGTILTSTDGVAWEPHASGTGATLNAVAASGSQIVAVGEGGTILTSPDGVTWTLRASGTENHLHAAVWTGTEWYVAGANATILASPDGITWTIRSTVVSSLLYAITWTGTQLVAVGNSSTILTSENGIDWVPRAAGISANFRGVAWDGSQLVAVGNQGLGNTVITSPDGVSWTSRNSGTTNALHSVAAGGGLLVATGASPAAILTSPNGVTWTQRTPPATIVTHHAAAWTGGKWVAVGGNGSILTSPDGLSWSQQNPGSNHTLRGISGAGDQHVAVGDLGVTFTSPDGVAWSQGSTGTESTLLAVIHAGGQWVTAGNAGALFTSPDGFTWTQRNAATGANLTSIAWSGSLYVAVGGSGSGNAVVTSPDGITWTQRTPPATPMLRDIVWTGEQFVAVGGASALTSPDGVEWTLRAAGAGTLHGLAWNGSLLVAVGGGGPSSVRILTSPDGIVWTHRTSPVTQVPTSVEWTGTGFLAAGNSDIMAYSPDGIDWINLATGAPKPPEALARVGNRMLVAGAGGMIMTKDVASIPPTPPSITQQPEARTFRSGSTARFTVAAEGAGTLGYQWHRDGVPLANGGRVSGATSDTLRITGAALADTGVYSVVVTSTVGGTTTSATSDAAVLTIFVDPLIASSPMGQTVAEGGTATFSAALLNGNLGSSTGSIGYQWRVVRANPPGITLISDDGRISGANTATLTITGVTAADRGEYDVVIIRTLGEHTAAINSAYAGLHVNTAPIITTQPQATTFMQGGTVALHVTTDFLATSTQSYQWYKNGASLANGGRISGATSATLNISNALLEDQGNYHVRVTRLFGGTTTNTESDVASVSINLMPVFVTPLESMTVTAGGNANFSVIVQEAGGTLAYQWRKGTTNIAGATNATYSVMNASLADTGSYSVVATRTLGGTTTSATSNSALLLVNAPPVITAQPQDSVALTIGQDFSFSVTAATTGGSSAGTLSYQWMNDGANLANGGRISGATSATLTISGGETGDVGAYTVAVTRVLNGTTTSTTSDPGHLVPPVSLAPGAFVIRVDNRTEPFTFRLPAGSMETTERLTLSISDVYGRTIWSSTVNPSRDEIRELTWNGKTKSGRPASAGIYVVRISVRGDGNTTHHARRAVTLKPR